MIGLRIFSAGIFACRARFFSKLGSGAALSASALVNIGFCGSAFAPPVSADGRCTITAPDFTVTIGNIAKAPPVNTVLSFSCQGLYPIRPGYQPSYCWHIHGQASARNESLRSTDLGPVGGSPPLKRLNFRLYSVDYGVEGREVYIGSAGGSTRYNITGIPNMSGDPTERRGYQLNWSNLVSLRFEENGQAWDYRPGNYRYTAGMIHGTLSQWPASEGVSWRHSCGNPIGSDIGGPQNYYQKLNFTINIKSYCNLAVRKNIDFGKVLLLDKPLKAEGVINVDCSAGTDFRVELGKGRFYSGNSRYMANADDSARVAYTLSPTEIEGRGTGGAAGHRL